MDADRPIASKGQDRLGFAPLAENLARVIADASANDGLVLGIEGAWGSGKSSVISLTKEALKARNSAPEIVDFVPWLVGSRDALLGGLFRELAAAVAKIEPEQEAEAAKTKFGSLLRRFKGNEHRRHRQKEALRKRIGPQLERFAATATLASKLGVPWAGQAASAAQLFSDVGSLAKEKRRLVKLLRQISRPIVVFVDDLDRLEPGEAAEVLRLIRAVADFPNVIYVLSYDPEVVANTLQKAVQVDDGTAFLEKIVQVSFRIPRPQAFDLRLWFRSEVELLFRSRLTEIDDYRLSSAIDVQGGRFLTKPRDVVRTLNALRLHALPVLEHIDIPDMIWLQLVRTGQPALYRWVEEYLINAAAVIGGAQVSDEEAASASKRLKELLSGESVDLKLAGIQMGNILPGLKSSLGFGRQSERECYVDLGRETIAPFIEGKRLGSPEHFRFYFAFAQPAGALGDAAFRSFIAKAESDVEAAHCEFEELIQVKRPQGGTMAEVLIDRLIAASKSLPQSSKLGIIKVLARSMDRFAEVTDGPFGGGPPTWRVGAHFVELLLAASQVEERRAIIDAIFADGQSLGWSTHILRDEIFSHGHFGDRREAESFWLLSDTEFSTVLKTMLNRYETIVPKVILNTPGLVSLLYAWWQGGEEQKVKEWVAARTATDEGLLEFLTRARSWRFSAMKRRDLQNFLDYQDALQRLNKIADSREHTDEQRAIARELLQSAAADDSS